MDRAIYRSLILAELVLMIWVAAGCAVPQPSRITIIAAGDVMPGRDFFATNADQWADKMEGVFSAVSDSDIFLFNLESPLSNVKVAVGAMDLTARAWFLESLPDGPVLAAGIENNHSHDLGEEGYIETRRILLANGIQPLGSVELVPVRVSGETVYMGAYNALDVDMSQFDEFVRSITDTCATEFCIISIHWGWEYSVAPSERQRTMAEKLSLAGVDLIAGHHPHVLQPAEWERGEAQDTLAAYSLGDLVFDLTQPDSLRSALLKVILENGRMEEACIVLIRINPYDWSFRIATGQEGKRIQERVGIPSCEQEMEP